MGIFDFLKRSNGNDEFAFQKVEHEENWAAYLSTIDGDAVGSIVVDLGLHQVAPVTGVTELLIVEIPMRNPTENGLPSDGEFEVLAEIEESFVSTLSAAIKCIFAGHLHCKGTISLYFFIEKGVDLDDLLDSSIGHFPAYSFKHRIKSDPNWEAYFDFMYPSPLQLQRLANESVIQNLLGHGDDLETKRKVEHWIYFAAESDRSDFLSSIAHMGFTVEDLAVDNEYKLPYKAQISREDKLTLDATDEYILDLWQPAHDCNGSYDGWETFIVKN